MDKLDKPKSSKPTVFFPEEIEAFKATKKDFSTGYKDFLHDSRQALKEKKARKLANAIEKVTDKQQQSLKQFNRRIYQYPRTGNLIRPIKMFPIRAGQELIKTMGEATSEGLKAISTFRKGQWGETGYHLGHAIAPIITLKRRLKRQYTIHKLESLGEGFEKFKSAFDKQQRHQKEVMRLPNEIPQTREKRSDQMSH